MGRVFANGPGDRGSRSQVFFKAVPEDLWGSPRGIRVKALDCGIIASEFVLQSRYYVYFQTNTLGERYEPPYPPSYGLNSVTAVLLWKGMKPLILPARTYIQQLCEDTGCSPEDLPEAMNDREKWRERVRDIHASGTT